MPRSDHTSSWEDMSAPDVTQSPTVPDELLDSDILIWGPAAHYPGVIGNNYVSRVTKLSGYF